MRKAAADEPAMTDADFRQRPKPVGFEMAYRIDGDVLVVDQTRKVTRVNLADVEQVRFTYEPGNLSQRGFRTSLRLRDGKSLTFGNLTWRGMVEVDRQEAPYRAFVARLCAAIAKANPSCRFVAGKTAPLWLAFSGLAAFATLGMAYFAFSAWRRGENGAALMSLTLFLLALWQLEPMVRLNRPRPLATGQVPEWLMP